MHVVQPLHSRAVMAPPMGTAAAFFTAGFLTCALASHTALALEGRGSPVKKAGGRAWQVRQIRDGVVTRSSIQGWSGISSKVELNDAQVPIRQSLITRDRSGKMNSRKVEWGWRGPDDSYHYMRDQLQIRNASQDAPPVKERKWVVQTWNRQGEMIFEKQGQGPLPQEFRRAAPAGHR